MPRPQRDEGPTLSNAFGKTERDRHRRAVQILGYYPSHRCRWAVAVADLPCQGCLGEQATKRRSVRQGYRKRIAI